MEQQTLDGSLQYPDQSCGLDGGSPAAVGFFITTSEHLVFTNTFIKWVPHVIYI